ncbi:MAG: hypothetical protein P4M06_14335 [Pandoraea sp.]|nr:hypothetical protein [Pandoraea sp.]MDR3398723.1 hypothetical protein [Pandoraea sp.]
MTMSEKTREQRVDEIARMIEAQLLRNIDSMRAKEAWTHVLTTVSSEEIVQALVLELSGGKYMLTPRCNCCGQRR